MYIQIPMAPPNHSNDKVIIIIECISFAYRSENLLHLTVKKWLS